MENDYAFYKDMEKSFQLICNGGLVDMYEAKEGPLQ